MKKITFFISFLLLHSYICSAQADSPAMNRTEVIKMGYITKVLNLNPQEAQVFWPLYNSYLGEIRNARLARSNDVLAFEETALNIKKKYRPEFKKILESDERVNMTFGAEQQFREMLRKELLKRQRMRKLGPA